MGGTFPHHFPKSKYFLSHPIIFYVITSELGVFWLQTNKLLCVVALFPLFITFICWSLCLGSSCLQFISHLLLLLSFLPPCVSSLSDLCCTSLTVVRALKQLSFEQTPSKEGFGFLLRIGELLSGAGTEPEAFGNSGIVLWCLRPGCVQNCVFLKTCICGIMFKMGMDPDTDACLLSRL